jgi:hypothetical protein
MLPWMLSGFDNLAGARCPTGPPFFLNFANALLLEEQQAEEVWSNMGQNLGAAARTRAVSDRSGLGIAQTEAKRRQPHRPAKSRQAVQAGGAGCVAAGLPTGGAS